MESFKSITIAVMGVVLLTIGAVLPANAELRLTAKGGLHSFEKDGFSAEDTAFAYGFGISYLPPIKDQVMDLTFEYMHGKVTSYVADDSFRATSGSSKNFSRVVTWDSFTFGAHYRPPVSTSIQPYIGGGVGIYVFNPIEKGFFVSAGNANPSNFTLHPRVRQGFHFDLGTDFVIAPHWIFGLEYKYVNANVSSDNNDIQDAWLNNLNFMTTTAAIRYAF